MGVLGPAELLATWESGTAAAPSARAMQLLALAGVDEPGGLALGRRDATLVACYGRWFGDRLEAVDACPACGEALEVAFAVDELLAGHELDDPPPACRVVHDGFDVDVRVPVAGDLLPPPADGRALLARCVLGAREGGAEVDLASLPPAVVDAVEAALAAADPFAELLVTLSCPACSHEWSAVLDPVEFVWERLERWARHLGDDVHVLASAYGWSEADILALTPQRRRLYLEAVTR